MPILRGLNTGLGKGAVNTLMYRSYTEEKGSEWVNVLATYSRRIELKEIMFKWAG